jgi:iron complex transport system ATP-binding protein
VLLLDEPISALDVRHQLEVLGVVRTMTIQRRLTTLIVLHDLNAAARLADEVASSMSTTGLGLPRRIR